MLNRELAQIMLVEIISFSDYFGERVEGGNEKSGDSFEYLSGRAFAALNISGGCDNPAEIELLGLLFE